MYYITTYQYIHTSTYQYISTYHIPDDDKKFPVYLAEYKPMIRVKIYLQKTQEKN